MLKLSTVETPQRCNARMNTVAPIARGQAEIKASPDAVYRLVSDPTVMVRFAEEVYRVRWMNGSTQARVGARFKGSNRNGWRRWWTTCRVTDADHGRRFAYEVRTPFLVPIARWQYDIEPIVGGCTVTETSWLHVPRWFVPIAIAITGEPDRPAANTAHIATTLRRLKEHLEAPADSTVE
ncbi:SRPBCC family protein [Actinophytocola sp.]|uniref:SRPBCC family protein n=1 Tax=Actinophytocola sp. TaxID=1872138 RepID=UPI002D8011A5|nr:SRPBCC family protein [Actinophytocola sp.]HET9141301.1 SRPBCC family protein [Actinophytocola sp.]